MPTKEHIQIDYSRSIPHIGLLLAIILLVYVYIKFGLLPFILLAAAPLLLFLLLYSVKNPYVAYTGVFVINYFTISLTRYAPNFPAGIILDVLILFTFSILIINSCFKKIMWSRAKSGLLIIASIWLIFCVMQVANPNGSVMAWITSIRGIAVYFLGIVILTSIILYRFKDMKRILMVLSVLTLIAIGKALIQKYIGFDPFEKAWLAAGGSSTHIIRSGPRYFSIYSDAANFGAGMGLAMVVFSIASLYYKGLTRFYYLAVAALAAYAMIISGTRGALAVPFAGYALYILLSKKLSIIIPGAILLFSAFFILNYTTIGQSRAEIRRMRSAFNTEDASFQVRLENQKKMAPILEDMPFGSGIGMGGGKAKAFAPNAPLSQLPTDSWFVMIWVETGIVGLVLHISILLFVILYGCYIVLFKLKNRQVQGLTTAMLASIFGIMITSYGNEIMGQFPTGMIVYTFMTFIFLSPRYDKEVSSLRENDPHEMLV